MKDGISLAKRCECFTQRLDREALTKANIPKKYGNCSFDNFLNQEGQTLVLAMGFAKTYADQFFDPSTKSNQSRGLLFYGPNGVGKTHLATAAFSRILSLGYSDFQAKFINYQALLELIRSGYDKSFGESRTEAYREVERVDLLLIDDLGANRVTDWVEDTITRLIAFRYDNNLPTMITTNYTPELDGFSAGDVPDGYKEQAAKRVNGLEYLGFRIGERATSRLRGMCKTIKIVNVTDKRGKFA